MAINFDDQTLPSVVCFRALSSATTTAIEVGFDLNGNKSSVRGTGINKNQAERNLFQQLSSVEKSAFILNQNSNQIRW